MKEGQGSPDVQVFLGSVEHFISHLSSARLNMENLFQLQPPEQQDLLEAMDQLSSPAYYNDAGLFCYRARSSTFCHPHQFSKYTMQSRPIRAWVVVEDITGPMRECGLAVRAKYRLQLAKQKWLLQATYI